MPCMLGEGQHHMPHMMCCQSRCAARRSLECDLLKDVVECLVHTGWADARVLPSLASGTWGVTALASTKGYPLQTAADRFLLQHASSPLCAYPFLTLCLLMLHDLLLQGPGGYVTTMLPAVTTSHCACSCCCQMLRAQRTLSAYKKYSRKESASGQR